MASKRKAEDQSSKEPSSSSDQADSVENEGMKKAKVTTSTEEVGEGSSGSLDEGGMLNPNEGNERYEDPKEQEPDAVSEAALSKFGPNLKIALEGGQENVAVAVVKFVLEDAFNEIWQRNMEMEFRFEVERIGALSEAFNELGDSIQANAIQVLERNSVGYESVDGLLEYKLHVFEASSQVLKEVAGLEEVLSIDCLSNALDEDAHANDEND